MTKESITDESIGKAEFNAILTEIEKTYRAMIRKNPHVLIMNPDLFHQIQTCLDILNMELRDARTVLEHRFNLKLIITRDVENYEIY